MRDRTAWVFDMDGTLTVAVHDFRAMRRQLGIPEDVNLIEGIDALPPRARAEAWQAVEDWEWEHAEHARPAPGVVDLLTELKDAGHEVGVLTRNRRPIALRTLAVSGLDRFFHPDDVLGRDEARPKPAPDGVRRLLDRWSRRGDEAVMVGDYLHDVQAGRAAGALTVLVRHALPDDWSRWVDHWMPDPTGLLAAWRTP